MFLLLCVLSTLWKTTDSLPDGAPVSVCRSMLPAHGGIPRQESPSPFRFEPTSLIVGQGQTIRVEIVATPRELVFGGFMLHARNINPPYQVIGRFSQNPDGATKFIGCDGQEDTATHLSPTPKRDLGLEWVAPNDFEGEVVFNGTVASKFDQFWVGIESEPVRIVKRNVVLPNVGISTTRPPITTTVPVFIPTTEKQEMKVDPFYQGCGSTKTCFGIPDGCVGDQSCTAVSAVNVRGDIYEFELQSISKQHAYVALGLSSDDKMGEDSVMACIVQGDSVGLRSSWTTPRPNLGDTREGVPQNIIRLITSSFVDGIIRCKIERDPVTSVRGKTFDLINTPYNLLLASGKTVRENGVGYHDLGRLPTSRPILLSEVQNLAGSSTLLLRLHGAFMIIAWIGTTSLGIVLARYFKQTWVGSQLCGKDQWFAWHRVCMVLTWSLTMAAFIIIFVQLNGWSYEQNPHAILGVITTVICFIQPIGAFFRPAPNSKNRPFFNWAHWMGGNIAHILAIVTIFFAVKLTKAELPDWLDWILVGFVAFHVCMHLLFSIAGCASDRRTSQRVNSFPMSDMSPGRGNSKVDRKQDAPFGFIRKLLLAIYIIIVILFVVALVVIVVLAPIEATVEKTVSNIKSKIMKDG